MRYADQWPGSNGVLFPHRQAGTTSSARSAVSLHVLLPMHGSLPAIYRTDEIRWGSDHQSSTAFQPPPHRSAPPTRTFNRDDERWWNPRVQLRWKLCANLPQEHSIDNTHFHCLWPSDEAGNQKPVPEAGAHQRPKRTGTKVTHLNTTGTVVRKTKTFYFFTGQFSPFLSQSIFRLILIHPEIVV